MGEAVVAFPVAVPALKALVYLDVLETERLERARGELGIPDHFLFGNVLESREPVAPAIDDRTNTRSMCLAHRLGIRFQRRVGIGSEV
jgi:hypothetical protein